MKVWTLMIQRNLMIPNYSMIPAIWWSPAILWSIRSVDFDNPKVYGDTSITDGLVLLGWVMTHYWLIWYCFIYTFIFILGLPKRVIHLLWIVSSCQTFWWLWNFADRHRSKTVQFLNGNIQGVFFNWASPENVSRLAPPPHKSFDWPPSKSTKCENH